MLATVNFLGYGPGREIPDAPEASIIRYFSLFDFAFALLPAPASGLQPSACGEEVQINNETSSQAPAEDREGIRQSAGMALRVRDIARNQAAWTPQLAEKLR